MTLTGDDTVADYQDALRSVEFSTPNQNPGTSRTIEFRADDGDDSAPVARQVVVTPVNDAPAADDETFNGASRAVGNTSLVVNDPSDGAPDPAGPQKTVTGDVLAGDTDVDWAALSVRVEPVTTIDGGSVVLQADGDFTYHPPQGCTGGSSDAFEYTRRGQPPERGTDGHGQGHDRRRRVRLVRRRQCGRRRGRPLAPAVQHAQRSRRSRGCGRRGREQPPPVPLRRHLHGRPPARDEPVALHREARPRPRGRRHRQRHARARGRHRHASSRAACNSRAATACRASTSAPPAARACLRCRAPRSARPA